MDCLAILIMLELNYWKQSCMKIGYRIYNVSDNKEYSYNDLLAYNKSTSQLKIPQNILYTLYWISVNVFLKKT